MASMPSAAAVALAEITARAGDIVMRHYDSGDVENWKKDDKSPCTAADRDAEKFILAELAKAAPNVPVVAEEQAAEGATPNIGSHFYLVGPLDVTKEFLNRNGEFTVNIAEIENGVPVRGCVYAPAKRRLFVGDAAGAFEMELGNSTEFDASKARPIHVRKPAADGMMADASRSHRDTKTDEYLS